MNRTGNVKTPPGALPIGLIGTGPELARLRPLLTDSPWLSVRRQGGAGAAVQFSGVDWHDDPRVLLNQGDISAVLLAGATHENLSYAALALEHECPAWRPPPLARTFAEATEVVARVRRVGVLYRVASWWEFVCEQAWTELSWPTGFSPLFSDIVVHCRGPEPRSWRSQRAEAGGGVLLQDGYPLLEALVAVRGLPESVSAAVGHHSRGGLRETEDVAIAVLRYRAGGLAQVQALWEEGPRIERLTHFGEGGAVRLTDVDLTLFAAGEVRDQRPLTGDWLSADLLRFVEQLRSTAFDRNAATLDRHLAVTALLESIYLAARTGQPESPRKLYEIQGLPVPE